MDLVTWKIRHVLSFLFTDDKGQDLVEYAMIFALMSLGATAGIGQVGNAIAGVFDKLASIIFVALQ